LGVQDASIGDEGHGRERECTKDAARLFAEEQCRGPDPDVDIVDFILREKHAIVD